MSYSSLTSPDHEVAEASKISEKSRPSIGNPAIANCKALGCEYRLDRERLVIAFFPDGNIREEWSFYVGKCGQKYSYCAKHGYKLEPRDDGKDLYSSKYSTCTLLGKSRKPT